MAYRDQDDDDHNDRGHGSSGYGHSSAGSSGKSNHDSKNFDTTSLVGEDGSFFGVKLSPGTASAMNGAQNLIKPWLRRTVQEKGEEWAGHFAKNQLGYTNPGEIAKFSSRAGEAGAWLSLFSGEVTELATNTKNLFTSLNELRQAGTPSLKLDGRSGIGAMMGGGDNEVMGNARSKIRGIWLARNVQTLVKSVQNIPQILLWNEEEKVKRKDRHLKNALKNTSNPDELIKLFEEEMGAGLSVNMEAARDKLWNQLWKAKSEKYMADFKQFEKTKQKQIEKEFYEELGFKGTSLKKEIDQPTFEMLEKYGLGGHYKQKMKPRDGYKPSKGTWVPEDPVDGVYELRATDSTAEKGFKKKLEQTITDKIKCEYVKEHGALDEGWKEKLNVGRSGRRNSWGGYDSRSGSGDGSTNKTIRERDYERFTKAFDEAHGLGKSDAKLKKEEDGTGKQLKEMAYSLGGSLAGDFFSGMFGTKALDKYRKEIAIDLITHLSRAMEKDDALEVIPPRENSKGESDAGFAKYIHSIFQKHQEDGGKSQIGERYFTHFRDAKWDDAAIQKLDDKDITPYEYAIKHLSKAIKDRRMDPLSLITFVGDKKRKLVRDSGKSFGPLGTSGDDEKVKAAIGKELDEFSSHFRNKKEMSEEQKSEAMADMTFSVEELRAHFASSAVSGEQKSFTLMDLEAHITDPKMIKELTGLDDKQLENLRKEMQGRFNKFMDAGVLALADMAEKNPEQLKTVLEMTDEELDVIKTISCKIEKGGKNVVEGLEKEERKTLETAVLNADVSLNKEKDKDGHGFWQRLIDRSRKKPEKHEAKGGDDHEASHDSHDDEKSDHHEEKPSRHGKKDKKGKDKFDEAIDEEMNDLAADSFEERDNRKSFVEREEKRSGRGFAKDDEDKPMLERLSARKSGDDSRKPSWDMSA